MASVSLARRISHPFLRRLATAEYPFKFRVYKTAQRAGFLKGALRLTVGGHDFEFPADEWHFWKIRDVNLYQKARLETLCSLIEQHLHGFDLVDLGADIGLVSRIISAKCTMLQSIIAVEPNPFSFEYLRTNLSSLSVPATALNLAVSDASGHAELRFDRSRSSDHSGFIEAIGAGGTRVEPLDSIYQQSGRDVVLKIDVEGQEQAVFRGGAGTLRGAGRVIMFLEVHRGVVARTGISPEQIFDAAEAIRPCTWVLSDAAMPPVDRTRPFFDQFPVEQHDVIGLVGT